MAVVTKKLKNDEVEIMFSVNSYNYNKILNTRDKRPSYLSNPKRVVSINDIVLLRKAPLCV